MGPVWSLFGKTTRSLEPVPRGTSNALETLPSQWIFFLDPATLLRVQSAGIRIDEAVEQSAWRELCAQDLGLRGLQLSGPTPGRSSGSSLSSWRRVFYDLDVGPLQNELRSTSLDYEFLPSLYGESAMVPEGIDFAPGSNGRTLRCRLRPSYLGRDRCVVARYPLSGALSATALRALSAPAPRVAYRSTGYYEVTIGSSQEHEMVLPCISVGLCSPRFSRHAVARQQAGWDGESWAWHSDDGLLFHASNRGFAFEGAATIVAAPSPCFGAADVVGCGVLQAVEGAGADAVLHAPRKIFYTLNGVFMGFAFDLDIPSNVPLWPCVGVDTTQWLSFNFGSEPFQYDLDQFPYVQVSLKTPFDTFADWSSAADGPPVQNAGGRGHGSGQASSVCPKAMRPLVAKLAPRRFLDVTGPAQEVVRRYQSQPRWLDAVDRLVNATLLDATGDGHRDGNRRLGPRLDEFFPGFEGGDRAELS